MVGRVPELLSPAGDWEALKRRRVAKWCGYRGLISTWTNLTRGHRATNFTLAELPEVMGYLVMRTM